MQAVASEMMLSETTFVVTPTAEGAAAGADYRVRIFTPTMELPFAGHPSIGTAWVLGRGRALWTAAGVDGVRGGSSGGLRSGVLAARRWRAGEITLGMAAARADLPRPRRRAGRARRDARGALLRAALAGPGRQGRPATRTGGDQLRPPLPRRADLAARPPGGPRVRPRPGTGPVRGDVRRRQRGTRHARSSGAIPDADVHVRVLSDPRTGTVRGRRHRAPPPDRSASSWAISPAAREPRTGSSSSRVSRWAARLASWPRSTSA